MAAVTQEAPAQEKLSLDGVPDVLSAKIGDVLVARFRWAAERRGYRNGSRAVEDLVKGFIDRVEKAERKAGREVPTV